MVNLMCLTGWSNLGTADAPLYRPTVVDDYALTDWEDVTGQPMANLVPDPNLMVLKVTCDEDTANRIEADGAYPVLSAEQVAEEVAPVEAEVIDAQE